MAVWEKGERREDTIGESLSLSRTLINPLPLTGLFAQREIGFLIPYIPTFIQEVFRILPKNIWESNVLALTF